MMPSNCHSNNRFRLSVSTYVLASLAALFSLTASATSFYTLIGTGSTPATVYQDVNFKGDALSLAVGETSIGNLRSSDVGNDRISSIRIAPGYEVYACKHSRLRGRCESFVNDTSDLRNINFNDLISSLIVRDTVSPVTVHKHVNYRGSSLSLREGEHSIDALRNSTVGNDNISSIRIADGYEVIACQHGGFGGECVTFTEDTPDLRNIISGGVNFNDVISSLIVQLASTGNNKAPVAEDLDLRTDADTAISFNVQSLVSDADGDSLTLVSLRNATLPGVVTDDGAGGFTFDPQGAFGDLLIGQTATQSFDYAVSDETDTTTGTITVVVEGTTAPTENQPPVAGDIDVVTDADSSIDISVQSLASDPDGEALVFTTTSDLTPSIGVLIDNGNGTFNYDPSGMLATLLVGQTETVSFEYTVSDGILEDTGTVSIEVQGTAVATTTYAIGETGPGGGFVFQLNDPVDGRSTSGLEFATAEIGGLIENTTWGCADRNTDVVDSLNGLVNVTDGSISTDILVAAGCSSAATAANDFVSSNGTSDWYLPSILELPLLIEAIGGTAQASIWSSTEHTEDLAWSVTRFGGLNIVQKNETEVGDRPIHVVPVRSF